MRRWSVVAAIAVVGVGLATQAGAEAKRLLGTVRVTGPVEAALPGEAWHPLTGGAAVEGMRIRTGAQGVAVVQLSNGDVLGVAESSSCELGAAARVRLLDGRLALRLQPDSGLVVDAAAATIRGPAVSPVAAGLREAMIGLSEGTLLVRPYRGGLEIGGPAEGVVTQVAAGQQAVLAPQAKAPTVTLASATPGVAPELQTGGQAAGGGFLASLGLSSTAAMLIGSGVAVVGGAVGGAAASGAFSTGGSGTSGGGGAQGSPFRPIRR